MANYQSARSQHYDQYRPAISPGGPPSHPVITGKNIFFFYLLAPLTLSADGLSQSPGGGAVGNNWRNQQRMERAESVYGGTKSLYHCAAKSPGPPSRSTNLNRSQSVYAKAPASGSNHPAIQPAGREVYASRGAQLQSAQSTYLAARNVDLIRTESIYATRGPPAPPINRAESIYGTRGQHPERHPADVPSLLTSTREPPVNYSLRNADRSKPESYQLEPIYQTRREVSTVAPSVEHPTQQQQQRTGPYRQRAGGQQDQMETSTTSTATGGGGAPVSPSDTSKDSAYGSVHGNSIQSPNEWPAANQEGHHQMNYNQQMQQQQQQQHGFVQPTNPASYPSTGHHHHQQIYGQKFRADLISPQQHSPGSFHSPVQY